MIMKYLRKVSSLFAGIFLAAAGTAMAAPSLGPNIADEIAANPLDLTPVVITYHDEPDSSDITYLKSLGIIGGVVLDELPMVQTMVNKAQFDALKGRDGIASLYGNATLDLMTNESRAFIGVSALREDRELTDANGGFPVAGGKVGVAYVDTGIDATHPDLQLGRNVVQNVMFPLAEVPLNFPSDFVPPVFLEDQLQTDVEGGHGTHGAGVTGGTGQASGTFYGGVAPGANLIGLVAGNDAGLSNFAILQAYDYALVNQFRYNIRVANNSFGTTLQDRPYDPFDPINVATRKMHDRFITVVFAAGNDGDAPEVINPLSVAPWVISVAAGEKQGLGTPAPFSSRGEDDGTGTDTAGQPADPAAPPNLRPDITAPGVDIKSTRSKGPGVTNLAGTALGQDRDIPPAFLPFYTTSQGTSFAAPHVSGVVALMIEADPMLTPDDVVTLLRGTATPMPPFAERVVGAGYVDAHNAVRAAANLAEVPHPADLTHRPGILTDVRDDQIGTTAQDIVGGGFHYDAGTDQLVYTLELEDLSTVTPNMRWNQSSVFDGITVFVSTNVEETFNVTHSYGTIAPDPDTGVNTQTTIGEADSGEIAGNEIRVRLSLDKINGAVGFDVFGTTSTSPSGGSQILFGTSFTGGLLLNADSAAGTDFRVGGEDSDGNDGDDGDGGDDGSSDPAACGEDGRVQERLPGAVTTESPRTEIAFEFREGCRDLTGQINYHPGNQDVRLELLDGNGNVAAAADEANGRRLSVLDVEPGEYRYRVTGHLDRNVDFVIRSVQEGGTD